VRVGGTGAAPLGLGVTSTGRAYFFAVGGAALGIAVTATGDSAQRLAQEDGWHILLESGDFLLLE
jgi:hypothetical protein